MAATSKSVLARPIFGASRGPARAGEAGPVLKLKSSREIGLMREPGRVVVPITQHP